MKSAVIMAGGKSSRMRSGEQASHKALVPVLGIPLLERNIFYLLQAGIECITVVSNSTESAIIEFVNCEGQALAKSANAFIECHLEQHPLGTIGVVQEILAESKETLVIVNVDNLCSIDPNKLLDFHHRTNAALTVAVHTESFRIPFGQVEIDSDRILRYMEKPSIPVEISSGMYVVGLPCKKHIPKATRCDVPELIHTLVDSGQRVSAFRHSCQWIDVNDRESVAKAETLISKCEQNGELFDLGVLNVAQFAQRKMRTGFYSCFDAN